MGEALSSSGEFLITKVFTFCGRQIGFMVKFPDGFYVSYETSEFVRLIKQEGYSFSNTKVTLLGFVKVDKSVPRIPYGEPNLYRPKIIWDVSKEG